MTKYEVPVTAMGYVEVEAENEEEARENAIERASEDIEIGEVWASVSTVGDDVEVLDDE